MIRLEESVRLVPFFIRGDAEMMSYLGVLTLTGEPLLDLFLIFSHSKDLLCVAMMRVLAVFTFYLGYIYMFVEGNCGGGEQWVATSRGGKVLVLADTKWAVDRRLGCACAGSDFGTQRS
ncbi:MAG: hypothetical protein M2R45_00564 [Verrucomicrobia subdivision 3 bacterium]|nr:hypothetical protein [Limisphaerales bacterium]MCS1413558.1 hypothetical protein [Limisphaerales bacterium]